MSKIVLFFIFVSLASCANDEEENVCGNSDDKLLGCWVTERCDNLKDIDKSDVDLWAKGVYEFSENETLNSYFYTYSDSSCKVDKRLVAKSADTDSSLAYYITNNTEEIDGILVEEISIEFTVDGESSEFFGGYSIDGDRLCTTNNLKFSASSITFSSSGEPTTYPLNYEYCLMRVNEL